MHFLAKFCFQNNFTSTCRVIIILLPLESATIGKPFGYYQHVDRPPEKFLEDFEMKVYFKTMTF